MTNKLSAQVLAYQLEGEDPKTIAVKNRAYVAWDETRGKRKWGSHADEPFRFQTFLVWYQLHYLEQAFAGTFDDFLDQCVAIEVVEDEELEADPTAPVTQTPDELD